MHIFFFGYSEGIGTTFHLTELALALNQIGINLTFIGQENEQESGLNKKIMDNGIDHIYDFDLSSRINTIKNQNETIFHCHGYNQVKKVRTDLGFEGPIVVTVHSYMNGTPLKQIVIEYLRYYYSKTVDAIVFLSPHSYNDFLKNRRSFSNNYIIPLGVEENLGQNMRLENEYPKPINHEYYNFNDKSRKKIVYLANFLPNKRHLKLIGDISPLLDKNPDIDVLFFGDGPLMDKSIKKVNKLDYSKRFYFFGRVKRSIISDLLPYFDLCLLVSKSETFSHATVEPLSLGIPVVATNVGIASNYVEDFKNGFLLPVSFNSNDLCNKIRFVLESNEIHKDQKNSIPLWKDVAIRYKYLYQSLLRN